MEYTDVNDAKEQVRQGKAWAAIYIRPDFTTDLLKRANPKPSVDGETINGSTIHIYADVTSEFTVQFKFLSSAAIFTDLQISVSINNQTLAAYEVSTVIYNTIVAMF